MHILFDLDGTITDPALGIFASIRYALFKMNYLEYDDEVLRKFIGPPLHASFKNHFGFNEKQVNDAVAFYREYYTDKGIFECTLYDGIDTLIKSLWEKGYRVTMATSKPEVYAKKLMEHFDLARYFAYIAGSELSGERSKKAEVIAYALSQGGEEEAAIMVGDTAFDIEGAKDNGIDSIAVLYGYGDNLENSGATYIAKDVAELETLLEQLAENK